jgi:hypothetical protein
MSQAWGSVAASAHRLACRKVGCCDDSPNCHATRAVEPGDVLFAAGDTDSPFFVIESGCVSIVQGYGAENRVIGIHGAHRFLGSSAC